MRERIDYINAILCINPVVLLRKRCPVKQQGVEQFCCVAQVCIQQKAGIGQILWQGRSDSQVVGNRIHLQRFTSKNGVKVCTPAPGKLTGKDLRIPAHQFVRLFQWAILTH